MVVVPEPAVKGCGALCAGGVDRAVGPAAEHGADEALGLAVGLWATRSGAQVADAERAAGDRVQGGDIGRAVVSHDALDDDAVALEELQRSPEKADRGRGLLVAQDLGVGQAGGVVDGDVDVVPAGSPTPLARAIGKRARVGRAATEDALARPALDAPKLFDVDLDQLTGSRPLVALGG